MTAIHLDHLGTPRLVTNASGQPVSFHTYFPFGAEATFFAQSNERLKFTGHERDLNAPAGPGDDLDYMHARYCSPVTGRFLSVDPKPRRRPQKQPQRWNAYSYVANNPLKHLDPDGRELVLGVGNPSKALEAIRLSVPSDLRGAITLAKTPSGGQRVQVDQAVKSSDLIFTNLQKVAGNPALVELNLVAPTAKIDFQHRTQGSMAIPGLSSIGLLGLTLPSPEASGKQDQLNSGRSGTTTVFVSDALTSRQQAPVIATELGAHALPALLGHGAAIPDEETHRTIEKPIKDAANANAERP